jgi:hypothetical protein
MVEIWEQTIVAVWWHDAHSLPGSWLELSEIDQEPCEVLTLGMLIPNSKPDHVVIAQSFNRLGEDDLKPQYDSILCIPVGMVRGMRVLSGSGIRDADASPR